jgi:hypothetical protein
MLAKVGNLLALPGAVYALALLRWSGRSLPAVFFPLLVLAGFGAAMPTAGLTFGLALAIFSWIRSGICYPRSVVQSLVREALLCGGGGLCLMLWGLSTPLSWGLGIWLFGLMQALFFILFEPGSPSAELPCDPFDHALQGIEALLDDR